MCIFPLILLTDPDDKTSAKATFHSAFDQGDYNTVFSQDTTASTSSAVIGLWSASTIRS